MRRLSISAVYSAAVFVAALAGSATRREPGSVAELESRVSALLLIQEEEAREKSAWAGQRVQMESLAALRRDEQRRLEAALAEAGKRAEAAREADAAQRRANAAQGTNVLLAAVSATRAGERLLAVHAALPDPLRERLEAGARFLRDRLKAPVSESGPAERLRLVAAFGYDLQHLLAEVQTGKQVIDLGAGLRVEAEVLYFGGALGFYLTPDGRRAGLLTRTQQGWVAEPRDSLAEQVALALRVKRKETPPVPVRLPMPPIQEERP